MAAAARLRLEQLGADPTKIVTSEWANLADHFEPESFDVVFSIGNSMAHAPDAPTMIGAFEAIRTILAPGGSLVIDSHDWEVVHATGSHVMVEPGIVERGGTRCVRTYSWHIPQEFEDPHVLEIAPIFIDGDRATLRSYPVTMWPFTRSELKRRLRPPDSSRSHSTSSPATTATRRSPADRTRRPHAPADVSVRSIRRRAVSRIRSLGRSSLMVALRIQ